MHVETAGIVTNGEVTSSVGSIPGPAICFGVFLLGILQQLSPIRPWMFTRIELEIGKLLPFLLLTLIKFRIKILLFIRFFYYYWNLLQFVLFIKFLSLIKIPIINYETIIIISMY